MRIADTPLKRLLLGLSISATVFLLCIGSILLLAAVFMGHSWIMVSGRVVDPAGKAISHTRIAAFNSDTDTIVDEMLCNDDGEFMIIYTFGGPRLDNKVIKLTVSREGYKPYTEQFSESAGSEFHRTVVLHPENGQAMP